MNSPSAALAWEIWHRHRNRLLAIGAVILGFALVYPRLCAFYGLRLDLPNALDAPASQIGERIKQGHPLTAIAEILTVLFLLLGPLACMLLSLLYLIWIFTFAEQDARKGFAVPARLFRLPISTGFLVGWLSVVGAATITLVYLGWTRLVHLPRIDIFEGYPNLLIWLTLLLVAQALVWALDGFPVLRLLALSGVIFFFGFLAGPSIHDHPWLEQNRSNILVALLALGGLCSFVGLDQIRHGGWQTWSWPAFLRARWAHGATANNKSAFKSAAQAQFWFEWRRSGQKVVLATCALSGVAFLIMAVVATRVGILSDGDTTGLVIYLLAVPIFLHFVQGVMPERTLPLFLAVRPLTSGEIVMTKLKVAGLSAALSWLVTLGLLGFVPLLGSLSGQLDPARLMAQFEHLPALLPVILVGVIFLTWRLVAANLCFGINHRWLKLWPVLSPYGLLILYGLLVLYSGVPGFRRAISTALPFVLGALVVAKFWLARRVFRVCLRRGWLSRSAFFKYGCVWAALAAWFLVPTLIFMHREAEIVSIVLGIILLLPLARIGLAVLIVNLSRHR
jgi:hypothetical protein